MIAIHGLKVKDYLVLLNQEVDRNPFTCNPSTCTYSLWY